MVEDLNHFRSGIGLHDLSLGELMGYEVVSVPFGAGLDTKTDPKMVDPPRPVLLQDAIFTNPKRILKRNGYDLMTNALIGGGTWSSPTLVKSYRNELVLAALDSASIPRLLSYSETEGAWNNQGNYASVAVSKTIVNTDTFAGSQTSANPLNPSGTANTSAVVIGNIALYVFDQIPKAPSNYGVVTTDGATYISVVDLSTGVHLADSVQITNSLGFSKAAILGSSTFAVFYVKDASGPSVCVRIITVSSSGVSIGSETVLSLIDSHGSWPNTTQFPVCYDYSTTAGGCLLAFAFAGSVKIFQLDTTGAAVFSVNITTTSQVNPITTCLGSDGNVWIYWISNGSTLDYAIYTPTLSAVLTKTAISGSMPSNIMQLSAQPVPSHTATQQTVYISSYEYPSGAASQAINPRISSATVNSSGTTTASIAVYLYGFDIYGKTFAINSRYYLPIVSLSFGAGATAFILDTALTLPVSKFLLTEAEGLYQAGFTSGGSFTDPFLDGVRYPSFIVQPMLLSSTQVFLGAGFVTGSNPIVPTLSSNMDAVPTETQNAVYLGSCHLIFDFNHPDAYQSVVQQDTLVLNGGIISMYDGSRVSELGFNLDPDNVSVIPTASGGSYATGTLIYFVTYEWIDANGNLYESAPSPGVEVKFSSGTTNGVTVLFQIYSLTQKTNVTAKVWRSDSAQGGNIAYLVAVATNTVVSGHNYAAITDDLSSANAALNQTLYTKAGAILANLSPVPSMILWTNNTRLWALDAENPETTLEYTKTASSGLGISFSTGLLEYLIDSRGGTVSGVSPMDEKTVVLKQKGLGFFIGDGATDGGTGPTLTPFQFIPSDCGCSNSKSVLLFSKGILFRASNNLGIFMLSRGLELGYFGEAVEAYNSQDIQSAKLVANRNQIRFLTSSGSSLLYDYVMGQWSVFTNHAGLSADTFNGAYIYVRSGNNAQDNNALFTENTSRSFLDNTTAYAPLMQLYWLIAKSRQGFNRVKRIMLLGDFQTANGGHGVQISAAYDFGTTFSTPIPYIFTGANGAFKYRERLPRQKCDAVQFLIQEIVTGASGEFIDFSDLGIEILAKTGLNKLPATRSVG